MRRQIVEHLLSRADAIHGNGSQATASRKRPSYLRSVASDCHQLRPPPHGKCKAPRVPREYASSLSSRSDVRRRNVRLSGMQVSANTIVYPKIPIARQPRAFVKGPTSPIRKTRRKRPRARASLAPTTLRSRTCGQCRASPSPRGPVSDAPRAQRQRLRGPPRSHHASQTTAAATTSGQVRIASPAKPADPSRPQRISSPGGPRSLHFRGLDWALADAA
jgi:hypothetical protein